MASSGFPSLDKLLGHEGYPDRSAILIIGPPGIGKEALGYRFAYSGLESGEFSAYATSLAVRDILQDVKAFGIDISQNVPFWFAASGGQLNYDVNDLASVSFNIKDILKKNSERKVRIVIESFSPFLMLNPPDTVYKFLSQLIAEVRESNAVLFGTLEEGMHSPEVLAAMQLLFDGVLEMRFFEEGLRLVPLMRIKKMRGAPPEAGYYRFSISRSGMEVGAYAR
ncbi:MAG TPA: ATPase domain-containing protein [Nitrososphaerales archaeon]|nr:ATPase domain-containing protein [Nitrososphaerales archaeon]